MIRPSPLALLVPAKVTAPQLNPGWVRRERLLARLSAGLRVRLTLVVAPAGFGKSTLMAQWLSTAPGLTAWLTLDEHDQDGLRVLAYVAGAIERVAPEALPTTRRLLTTPEPPPLYVILQALLVDLNALPDGLTLVLDDYHTITADPIHQAVAYLLRHLPPTSRLIILSRTDPPLPLARLRAERQLIEVRAQDLRFTDAEARALVTTLVGQAPDDATVAAIQEETEGWAIALQFAALAALEAPRSPRPPSAAGAIAEYLAEEVLDQQPMRIREALLVLAVPERVCVELAAALLDTPDAVQAEYVLGQVLRANLLLVLVDAEGYWYRFHHLFRDLLLRRLRLTFGSRRLRELQLRAAAWLEREGLFEEAVRGYLAAGDQDTAASLVERLLAPDLGRRLTPIRPAHWLRLLPRSLIARRPGLALLEARIAFATLNIPAMAAALARVETLLASSETSSLPPPWPTFPVDLTLLRAVLAYMQGRLDAAIPALEAVLEQEPGLGLTGQALMVLGRAYAAAGRYDEGVQRIEARRLSLASLQDQLSHSVALCAMHGMTGGLGALGAEAAQLASAVAASHAGDSWVCFAEVNLGRVAYECSDLPGATRHFAAVVERRYHTSAAAVIGALIGRALSAALQGLFAEAARYAQEAWAFAVEVGSPFARNEAYGCLVRLALAQGDLEAAMRAAEEIALDQQIGSSSWYALEPPQLCKAAALIAAGTDEHLRQAEVVIADVLARLKAQHNTRPQVCALATLALLRQAQGRMDEALDSLQRAVALAAPRGYQRALADRGTALVPLLQALSKRGIEPAYLTRVLAVIEPEVHSQQLALGEPRTFGGLELLTSRELEILVLLGERWSDKEIAERLIIAPNTVRKHTSTIYGKLGVSNRREAAETARALGLLPAHSAGS